MNRRTTVLSQDGPFGNGGVHATTGIPVPASISKKPALRAPAARPSMMPGPSSRIVSGGQAPNQGMGSSQDRRSTIARGGAGVTGVGATPQAGKMLGGGQNRCV